MGGGGKGGSSAPPEPPLSERVSYVDSAYTSWDGGDSYQQDPNTHFVYEGQNYWISPGEDINNRDTWEIDANSNYHLSNSQYLTLQNRRAEFKAAEVQNAKTLELMQKRNELAQKALEDERAKVKAAEEQLAKEQAEAQEKRDRQLKLAAAGRAGTLLTGGAGDTSKAPVRKKTLGAVG